MAAPRDCPLLTVEYEVDSFQVEAGAAYLYELSVEDRSRHVTALMTRSTAAEYIQLSQVDDMTSSTSVEGWPIILLRRRASLEAFLGSINRSVLYIDITGMQHNTWAPLVKVALEMGKEVRAVYVEPRSYSYSKTPRQGEIFDLSESIKGISPIPLFTSLADQTEPQVCFIPLLGFEGTRFAFMLEQIQPPDRKIYPIIGVPGFRPEYPFHAYLGNAAPLERTKSFRNVRFAKSNCPFSVYYAIERIIDDLPDEHVKIGLIGTKPHALGAGLKAVAGERPIELVYDQVIRKSGRTSGQAKCLVYFASHFMPNLPRRRVARAS